MQALLIVCSYAIICGCRFILGVGVGGQFPLSAAAAKDSAAAEESSEQRVGWAFFWQTPGSLAPYLVDDTGTIELTTFLVMLQMSRATWTNFMMCCCG